MCFLLNCSWENYWIGFKRLEVDRNKANIEIVVCFLQSIASPFGVVVSNVVLLSIANPCNGKRHEFWVGLREKNHSSRLLSASPSSTSFLRRCSHDASWSASVPWIFSPIKSYSKNSEWCFFTTANDFQFLFYWFIALVSTVFGFNRTPQTY